MSCHDNELFIKNTREEFAKEFAILDDVSLCAEDKPQLLIKLLGNIDSLHEDIVNVLGFENRWEELYAIATLVFKEYKI
jgi:F0F1-type ATP synthase delta subunit